MKKNRVHKTVDLKYNKPIKSRILMKWKQKQEKNESAETNNAYAYTRRAEAAQFNFQNYYIYFIYVSTLCDIFSRRKFHLRTFILYIVPSNFPNFFFMLCLIVLTSDHSFHFVYKMFILKWVFIQQCVCVRHSMRWFTLYIAIVCVHHNSICRCLTVKTWYIPIRYQMCARKKRYTIEAVTATPRNSSQFCIVERIWEYFLFHSLVCFFFFFFSWFVCMILWVQVFFSSKN